MSVIYSNTPENVATATNTPMYQDWGPIPNIATYYWSNTVPVLISAIPIRFYVKDFFGREEYSQYSEISLRCWTSYIQPIGLPYWMTGAAPDNGYPIDYFNPLVLNETGIYFDFLPAFSNLNQLPQGTYEFQRNFQIRGKNAQGIFTILETFHN